MHAASDTNAKLVSLANVAFTLTDEIERVASGDSAYDFLLRSALDDIDDALYDVFGFLTTLTDCGRNMLEQVRRLISKVVCSRGAAHTDGLTIAVKYLREIVKGQHRAAVTG